MQLHIAGKGLKSLYPYLFHVTCVVHLLYNCAMHIRAHYPSIDNLVSCVKACVMRSHSRWALFQPSWISSWASRYSLGQLARGSTLLLWTFAAGSWYCEQFQIQWCSCEKHESSCEWWKPNTQSGTNQALLLISCKSPGKGWMFGLYNSRSSC